jgi:hypothetical protein
MDTHRCDSLQAMVGFAGVIRERNLLDCATPRNDENGPQTNSVRYIFTGDGMSQPEQQTIASRMRQIVCGAHATKRPPPTN